MSHAFKLHIVYCSVLFFAEYIMEIEKSYSKSRLLKVAKMKIQLKWVPQSQFAGIFVAIDKDFFKNEGIEVEIISGGPGIDVDKQVANNEADLGITSLSNLLVYQEKRFPLVSIAQIMQGYSMGLISRKSSGIDTPEKMRGRRIGTFGGSNQNQLQAFLRKFKLEVSKDTNLILQNSINQFINGKLDVGAITLYNELQSVLESGLKESDLNIFMYKDYKVNMLEDIIIARNDWIAKNQELAVKALGAIIKGWNYAAANRQETVDIVMKYADHTITTKEHQTTMLNVMLKLITPTCSLLQPCYIGKFNKKAIEETIQTALKYSIINKRVNIEKVYNPSIIKEAIKGLQHQNHFVK